jgi:hypothetical protein
MVVSLKANKKRILAFLVLAAIVIVACVLLRHKGGGESNAPEVNLATNEERVSFLSNFGWEVDAEPSENREVMIPEKFNDVYTAYNEMQKAQGYDLKPYAGYRCMQYKYKVSNYPNEDEVYATMLVYDNKLLGGDIACVKVDGFMHGFAADSTRYGDKAGKKKTASENEENAAAPQSSAAENTVSTPAENNAENNGENNAENNAENNTGENTGENTGNAENAENAVNEDAVYEDTADTAADAGDFPTD